MLYDFCYYWQHRAGHRVALFWAAHVVHHQSEDYNLSTALRQTSSGWLAGWIFYLPMAVVGVPPLVFGVVALIDLLYQFWVHTEQVGKLGWFDRWFCAPSNHRVHHAVNDALPRPQLRRHADRLGSPVRQLRRGRRRASPASTARARRCAAGTRCGPTCRSTRTSPATPGVRRAGRDKLRVWLKPPGWRPADVATRWPKPAFAVDAFERFDPPVSRSRQLLAFVVFAALLGATTLLLWHSHALTWPARVAAGVAIVAALWVVGRLSEGAPLAGSARPPTQTPRPSTP